MFAVAELMVFLASKTTTSGTSESKRNRCTVTRQVGQGPSGTNRSLAENRRAQAAKRGR